MMINLIRLLVNYELHLIMTKILFYVCGICGLVKYACVNGVRVLLTSVSHTGKGNTEFWHTLVCFTSYKLFL